MKCHEGSSSGLMKCSAASKTTNVAAPANDRSAAVRGIALTGLGVPVSSAIRPSPYYFASRVRPSCLPGPGHGRLVSATTRIHPLAGQGVAVVAELALGVRRGTLLPSPDREGVSFQFVDVVEGIAHVVVEARLYLLARLRTEGLFVADDLDALDPLAVLL